MEQPERQEDPASPPLSGPHAVSLALHSRPPDAPLAGRVHPSGQQSHWLLWWFHHYVHGLQQVRTALDQFTVWVEPYLGYTTNEFCPYFSVSGTNNLAS